MQNILAASGITSLLRRETEQRQHFQNPKFIARKLCTEPDGDKHLNLSQVSDTSSGMKLAITSTHQQHAPRANSTIGGRTGVVFQFVAESFLCSHADMLCE